MQVCVLFSNLKTGNFGSLIKVFLLRHPELEASVQTDNALFLWQVRIKGYVQYSIVFRIGTGTVLYVGIQ
jgi:hypothetical protein